jgi:hypothetical protein
MRSAKNLRPFATTVLFGLELVPVAEIRFFRSVPVARSVRFNQMIVTGPPGSGKSTLIRKIGGWPEEGFVDLTQKGWWRSQALFVRPREIHLGLPFEGESGALSLFDDRWLDNWSTLVLEETRIQLPPPKKHLLSVNWHGRFVFEFLLPSPERIFAVRCRRARAGTHPVDTRLDMDQIREQLNLFARVAQLFHRHGMRVYIRERVRSRPMRIRDAPPHAGDSADDVRSSDSGSKI